MNTPAPIDFHFDLSSPYSYIASEWIEVLAARHGRTVRWQTILLGATFRAAELKPLVAHPLKREYSLRDFERSARYAGVPLKIPATFPISTHNAACVFWWLNAEDGARAADWARCCLRALFACGADLSDAPTLAAPAGRFGLEAEQAEAVWNDVRWKARLKGRQRRGHRRRRVQSALLLLHRRRAVPGQRPPAADRALTRKRAVLNGRVGPAPGQAHCRMQPDPAGRPDARP